MTRLHTVMMASPATGGEARQYRCMVLSAERSVALWHFVSLRLLATLEVSEVLLSVLRGKALDRADLSCFGGCGPHPSNWWYHMRSLMHDKATRSLAAVKVSAPQLSVQYMGAELTSPAVESAHILPLQFPFCQTFSPHLVMKGLVAG